MVAETPSPFFVLMQRVTPTTTGVSASPGKLSLFRGNEKCHSKCDQKTEKSIFLICQGVTQEGRVLLRPLKTETERRFRAVLSRLRRTRRRRGFCKSPWYNGFCRQKESRHSDGCLTIGSGEWNRTIDLQVMSLMSYHCSTPRHCFDNIGRGGPKVKASTRIFRVFRARGGF